MAGMLKLLLICALLVPAAPRALQTEGPAPELVAQAVEAIDGAFKNKKTGTEKLVAALNAYGRTADKEVVKSVAAGLKRKQSEVQLAAIEALRFNPHPDALEALHHSFKKDKKLRKKDELYSALVKAICQHGSESSIPLLSRNPLHKISHDVARARVLGFGMIRHADSVAGLVKLLQSVTARVREPLMEDFRTSLYLLTGVDKGTNTRAWLAWWNKNKKTIKVATEAPKLPELAQIRWERYWGLERTCERGKKRRERGDDPE